MRVERSRVWPWLIAGVGVLGLFAIALLVLVTTTGSRLERSKRAIQERGELLTLPDEAPTEAGRATRAWLERFQECAGANDEWRLLGRDGLVALLALPDATALSADERAGLQRLVACLAPGEAEEVLPAHARALLRDGVPPADWDECSRCWIETRALCLRPAQALVSAAHPAAPLDRERICTQIRNLHTAHEALLGPTYALGAHGDATGIVRRVRDSRALDPVFEKQPGIVAMLFRVLCARNALDAGAIALARFAPSEDLSALAPLLDLPGNERAAFRRALLEERAISLDHYRQIGGTILVEYDQAFFLDTYASLLAALDAPTTKDVGANIAAVQASLDQHFESWLKYTTPVAPFLMPRFEEGWLALVECRAMSALVELGLRVRGGSVEAALAEAARSHDPFTDGALHARIDPDGLLTLWSAGRNGIDDGGPRFLELEASGRPCDDLVVRVRLR